VAFLSGAANAYRITDTGVPHLLDANKILSGIVAPDRGDITPTVPFSLTRR
jgi:hypothetical protein